MDLVLFTDALTHMMRISRLLCMDRGSALLIGVGGSGKQSLTRLAASIAGAFTFQIQVTKTYNVMNLFEDLKTLYKIAGLKGQKVAFIFTDAEVKEESFLEYINQLLMTGEVAGLFPKEEQDALVNDCRPAFKKEAAGQVDSYDNLWNFFLSRVRDNLHLCLCFSPVGDKFSRRARDFPGLINGCTIDWFLPWPQDALVAVSTKFIGDFQMACSDDDVKGKLQLHMGGVHVAVTKACSSTSTSSGEAYTSDKSYLSSSPGTRICTPASSPTSRCWRTRSTPPEQALRREAGREDHAGGPDGKERRAGGGAEGVRRVTEGDLRLAPPSPRRRRTR